LHAAITARPAAGLADMNARTMQAMYDLPADRARQLAIAGTPSQVANHLALYLEAGAELIAVTCDPAHSAQSWELLADVRRLLNQR
jgi:alkanesulfonate monooxygenase SsuD/methylene tetrahydromethanopterin reductase-like flavin-dependent oxidoreductase (luciferase family)